MKALFLNFTAEKQNMQDPQVEEICEVFYFLLHMGDPHNFYNVINTVVQEVVLDIFAIDKPNMEPF